MRRMRRGRSLKHKIKRAVKAIKRRHRSRRGGAKRVRIGYRK